VWFVPVLGHPFDKGLAPFEERVAMAEGVAALVPGARVCTVERDLPVPSYTIDTLAALAARHPEHTFRLVVGADVLAEVHRWKDWDGIVARFGVEVVGRQGYPPVAGAIDFPGVSATEIRARVARGESVAHLVPAVLLDRVLRLYRASPG
jgi:nicotinate-nucleotide adenylyltransferase